MLLVTAVGIIACLYSDDRMYRREFITLLGSAAAWPLAARGQQLAKVHRVGILWTTGRDRVWHLHQALIESLRALGYVEGRNVIFDDRFAEGKMERLASFAAELVSLRPDVIVVAPNTSVRAVMQASHTIPIVMTYSSEPVANGLVTSLARPGGNITGLTSDVTDETYALRLQLLKEINPKTSRVAVVWNPDEIAIKAFQASEEAAKRLNITVRPHEVRNITDFEPTFSSIKKEADDSMLVFTGGLTYARRQDFIDFAARERLPTMYCQRESVEDGGLVSYGVNTTALYRRAASFVDKILKGANPGDLPIEQPTILELIINVRTAKAIGLAIPESFLVRADNVIE
jgi:putative ABC transport system substrate-binding protein